MEARYIGNRRFHEPWDTAASATSVDDLLKGDEGDAPQRLRPHASVVVVVDFESTPFTTGGRRAYVVALPEANPPQWNFSAAPSHWIGSAASTGLENDDRVYDEEAYITVRPDVNFVGKPMPMPSKPIKMGTLMSALPPGNLPRKFSVPMEEEPSSGE